MTVDEKDRTLVRATEKGYEVSSIRGSGALMQLSWARKSRRRNAVRYFVVVPFKLVVFTGALEGQSFGEMTSSRCFRLISLNMSVADFPYWKAPA